MAIKKFRGHIIEGIHIIKDVFLTACTIRNIFRFSKLDNDVNKIHIKDDTINILMNGPSLQKELNNNLKELKKHPIMCANNIVNYNFYTILKPAYYVIADAKFWEHGIHNRDNDYILEEQRQWDNISESIIKKTNWNMILFLPIQAAHNRKKIRRLKENRNITICFYNNLPYSGCKCFRNWFYKKQLCAPPIANVLAAAILLGIIMGEKVINLYGADHSFFSDLKIDENNRLTGKLLHVYDYEAEDFYYHDPTGKYLNMGEFLEINLNIWKTYYELQIFAKVCGTHIINRTENSMIDAFERHS